MYFVPGVRQKPAAKPTHRLEPRLRSLIDAMAQSKASGWSEVALAILGSLHKLRRSFGKRLKKAVRRREDRAISLSVGNGSMTLYCTIGFGEEVAR
jgi:hypothetical protein